MRKVRVEPRYLKQTREHRFSTVDPQPRYVGVGVSRRGPSARIGAVLVGVPAASTAVGRAGVVFARRSTVIAGVTAEAYTEALDGFPASYPHIPGQTAQSTSESFAGSVSTNWNVNVAGQSSIAVATSGVGVVSAAGNIHIVGQPITSSAVAESGEVATTQNVDAVGPVSTSIGLAPQGSVSTGTTIEGVTAEATSEALAGVMEDAVHADVRGDTVLSDAQGFAGQVSTHPVITGVTAAAASTALPGTVVAGVSVQVNGFVADSTGTGQSGVVQAVRHVNITGPVLANTSTSFAGTVSAARNTAFDNAAYSEGSATTSLNLTVADGAAVIVFVAGNLTSAARVDGTNMTLVGKTSNAAMYYLNGLPAGTRTIQTDRSGSSGHIVSAISYTGVASITGGTLNSGSGSTASGAPSGSGLIAVAGFDFGGSTVDTVTSNGSVRVKYRRTSGNCLAVADHSSAVSLTLPSSGSWTSIAVWLN